MNLQNEIIEESESIDNISQSLWESTRQNINTYTHYRVVDFMAGVVCDFIDKIENSILNKINEHEFRK
jgi:hypothetical protein